MKYKCFCVGLLQFSSLKTASYIRASFGFWVFLPPKIEPSLDDRLRAHTHTRIHLGDALFRFFFFIL